MSKLFVCDISGDSLCLKCVTCKIKAAILEGEIAKIDDDLTRTFMYQRILGKRFYKHIMEEFGIQKLYQVKSKIRLGRDKIRLETDHIVDDIIKKYKREENLKNILS